ncbi:MAG: hypothetical protein OXH75_17715 [Acidobacteria bacterium]|nr:hypothetical protein [Acidobacteriota bacterium]
MDDNARGKIRIVGASREALGTWVVRLADAGHAIDQRPVTGPQDLKRLGLEPPCAVVIDLDRAPARGRDIGLALRQRVATRRIPIVFVATDREVFARLELPLETMHAVPKDIVTAVASALAMPPSGAPPRMPSNLDYSATPLPRKLGIKAGSRVVLVRPPAGFPDLLQPLPSDVVLRTTNRGRRDITLWFTRSRRELERGAARMTRAAEAGRLWILWPKKSSPLAADHTERDVRRVGIGAGLVDFKVCAVDADWSGLAFVRRRNGSAAVR